MTDRDLSHIGDDQAFARRLNDATTALQRLPSRNDNARLLAAIQSATLQILLGATDSAASQVAYTGQRTDRNEKEGGSIGFSIGWPERAGNTRAGEKQNDGCAAAGGQA